MKCLQTINLYFISIQWINVSLIPVLLTNTSLVITLCQNTRGYVLLSLDIIFTDTSENDKNSLLDYNLIFKYHSVYLLIIVIVV